MGKKSAEVRKRELKEVNEQKAAEEEKKEAEVRKEVKEEIVKIGKEVLTIDEILKTIYCLIVKIYPVKEINFNESLFIPCNEICKIYYNYMKYEQFVEIKNKKNEIFWVGLGTMYDYNRVSETKEKCVDLFITKKNPFYKDDNDFARLFGQYHDWSRSVIVGYSSGAFTRKKIKKIKPEEISKFIIVNPKINLNYVLSGGKEKPKFINDDIQYNCNFIIPLFERVRNFIDYGDFTE